MKIERIPGTNILDIKVTEQEVDEVCSKQEPLSYQIGITPSDIVSITDIHAAEKLCLAVIELRNVESLRTAELELYLAIRYLKKALKDMPEDTRAVDFINEFLVKLDDKHEMFKRDARISRTRFEKVTEALKEDL